MSTLPPRNSVIEAISDETELEGLYRILHIEQQNNVAILFPMVNPPIKPLIIALDKLLDAIKQGHLQVTNFKPPAYMLIEADQLTEAAKGKRDKNWEIIKPLVEAGPRIYFRSRGSLIRQRASEVGKTPKAIYRVLYQYWHYGQTLSALTPASAYAGAKGKPRDPKPGVKRGRPSKALKITGDQSLIGVNVSEVDRRNFNKAIDLFHKRQKLNLPKTYQKMREHYYNDGYQEKKGKQVPTLKPSHLIPSLPQFRYWYYRERDEVALLKASMSASKWQMNYRGLPGSAQQNVAGPCSRFEIDATIADIFLVSRYNSRFIIGRPTIYIVVDVFSRMVVGLYIGWEHPSWEGARLALINAFTDKVSYCAQYGVEITLEDWPCRHLAQRILADRGEFIGDAPSGMMDSLDIQVENTPPYRGDLKGIVESRFAIYKGSTIEDLPASIDKESGTRGEPDPRLEAALDIDEFTAMMIDAVIHHNKFAEKPHLLNKAMIAEDVTPTPIHIWNWGLLNASGAIEAFHPETVRIHLMLQGEATVKADGIHFKGMRYTTQRAIAENWFSLARSKKSWRINIRYDNTTTNEIWFYDRDSGILERCDLIDADARYHNMRMEEITDMLDRLKVGKQLRGDEAANNLADINTRKDSTSEQVSQKAKKVRSGMSKAAQIKGMRENRQAEREIERTKKGRANGANETDTAQTSQESAKILPLPTSIDTSRERNKAKLLEKLQQQLGNEEDE